MVIFSLGGSSIRSRDVEQRIRIAKALAPDAIAVILSDSSDAREVRAALDLNVDGFLPSDMRPELVLQALSFILNGGSFFPPSAMREHTRSQEPSPVSSSDVLPSSTSSSADETPSKGSSLTQDSGFMNGTAAVAPPPPDELGIEHCSLASSPNHALVMTGRQREVLDLLKNGEPNKVIARRLSMSEATVKVHVRQIMRKLGASNRTQAAVYATSLVGQNEMNGQSASGSKCEDKRGANGRRKGPDLTTQAVQIEGHA